MSSIGRIIGELLLRHNCVIIPSFGGFVAKQTPAVIDYASGFMSPPKKSLLFNRLLINNDGLLLNEIAREQQSTYDEAVNLVQSIVSEWQSRLAEGERITIENVGFLYADSEKNICFEQDRFFNLLLESYGLSKVYFISKQQIKQEEKESLAIKSITTETPIQKEESVSFTIIKPERIEPIRQGSDSQIKQRQHKQTNSGIWRYVAAACLIPIAFYSFWIPLKTNAIESGVISFLDFNVFYKAGKGTYFERTLDLKELEDSEYITLEDKLAYLPDGVTLYDYEYNKNITLKVDLKKHRPLNIELSETNQSINSDEKLKNESTTQRLNNSKNDSKNENGSIIDNISPLSDRAKATQKDVKSKGETSTVETKKTTNRQQTTISSIQHQSDEIAKKGNSNNQIKNKNQFTTITASTIKPENSITETKNANVVNVNSNQVKATNQQKNNKSLNQTNAGTSSSTRHGNSATDARKNDATTNSVSQNTSQTQKNLANNLRAANNPTNINSTGTNPNAVKPITAKNSAASPIQKSTATVEFIVGSFSSEENAKNLVSTLKSKGIQAEVSGLKNGLIRVSAGKANSEEELQKIIQKVKSQGLNGWIAK